MRSVLLDLPPPLADKRAEVCFSRRKRILIKILPDHRITVHAPLSTDLEVVGEVLRIRMGWIERQLRRMAENPRVPSLIEEGALHYILGKPLPLSIRRATHSGMSVEDGELVLRSRSPENRDGLERTLRRQYGMIAEGILKERIALWAPRLPSLPEFAVRFRWMRGRWGSCSNRGVVVFNTQLVKAPMECIDFVVVHELCHLLHHNHGPGFKMLLGSLLPDWRETGKLLKKLPLVL